MQIGVVILPTDLGIRFDHFAAAAEERGLDRVAVAHHMHEPIGSTTDRTPPYFAHCLDPWVALSAAAVATSRIRLGTCVYLMAQHHPLVTAKAVASLDHLSGGRVDLGVGWGWNRAEAADYGVLWTRRRDQLGEHVAAARALWASEVASFDGDFVRFGSCRQLPKPVQAHVPIHVGCGAGPRNFDAIASWADGWLPVGFQVDDPAASVKALRAAVEAKGRDPDELTVHVCNLPTSLAGADVWRDAGATVTSAVIPGDASAADTMRALDTIAGAAAALR